MISRLPGPACVAALGAVLCALAGPAGAAPGPRHEAFALIVTNNRSATLGRPSLQYADDDGARYYELFLTLAPAEHLRLVTEFDRDSAREFPPLAAIAARPSRGNVEAAARELAQQVASARRAGAEVDFYFVFAGHGDVDRGRGFLELSDGAFYGDDVEAVISRIHPSHAHIILDSCNSYFVINARKPGGRRFATPADAMTGLPERSPDIGVFVSTSAEAEVFEWSELQSGVFSHAVRSGLAGAADANHDGTISYDELRAFVDIATSEIRNPAYRPKVFARGPGGDDRAALFTPTIAGQQLTLDEHRAIRITVRDRDDLVWLDAYKEAGAQLTLRLPPALSPAFVDELRVSHGEVTRIGRRALPGPATERIEFVDLPAAPPRLAARGPDELFRALFTAPFGPAALAHYEAERASAPAPTFGISHDDAVRMADLLAQADDSQREFRWITGALTMAVGAAGIAGAALTPEFLDGSGGGYTREGRIGVAAGGALLVGLGLFQTLRDPASEHLHADLANGLAAHADPGALVVDIDRRLHAASASATRMRRLQLGGGALLLGGAAVAYAYDRSASDSVRIYSGPAIATLAALGTVSVLSSFLESPIERTTRLWDHDPGIVLPRLGFAPTRDGAALSLSGRF